MSPIADNGSAPATLRAGRRQRFAAVALLLLAFGLMLSSAARKSATVDEQSHLFRGVAFLKSGATHFLLGHPLLGGTLSALPLLSEPELHLPTGTPAWETGDWSVAGDVFLWHLNDNPQRLILLGRLLVIWLTLLLGALVFRWGREWAGPVAGLLAMALVLMDPNMLAHGRLITGDLPLVLFFIMALYGFWRWTGCFLRHPSGGYSLLKERPTLYLLLSGVGLGLAGATKFNAALLLPILALWAGILAWRRRSVTPLLALVAVGVSGWITIWAIYGFSLWRGYLPGGAFWDDVLWQLSYVGDQHGVYLLGETSASGWLSYFPIAFGLKTPVVTLALLGLALYLVIKQRSTKLVIFLLLPALIYFVGSMVVALNIGYRYLLPMLPLLFLLVAIALTKVSRLKYRPAVWLAAVIVSYALLALWHWPDYIPYYNVLAGRDSWTILSDSNVDWGQDLVALRSWQQENETPLKLSYFGTAHPSKYGLVVEALPTWSPGPEQGDLAKQSFYPPDPAPGTYAISVTNLHGVVLGDGRDTYAEFRDKEPLARVGGSIFVYQVPSRGEAVDVAFSGLAPAGLEAELHERFGTNDVRARWLDATTSAIWPEHGGWLVISGEQVPGAEELVEFWPGDVVVEAAGQSLYRLSRPPTLDWGSEPVDFGEELTFLGQKFLTEPGEKLTLLTAWQVSQPTERPLKLFVHALDNSGQIVGQWDGLDVDPLSWRTGDVFVQRHEIALPEASMPVEISIGVYDGETLDRLGEPVSFVLHE